MKKNDLPRVERLRELLNYDPETGLISWAVDRSNVRKGKVISCRNSKGHVIVRLDGKNHFAHRVIWKLVKGTDPIEQIDHSDGNPANNIWTNLREATHSQNLFNQKIPSHNTSGIKGICFDKSRGKWLAQIAERKKHYYVGRYEKKEDAEEAINAARAKLHGEFARAA